MSTQMITVALSQISKNPYRDFDMATIREDTVLSLMESINDTDFWQNFPLRLKDNQLADGTVIVSQEQIDALLEADHDWSLESFEKPHGHQRFEALKRLEWVEVTLILKYITDETMLLMMANENKEGYGGNTGVICETVSKVSAEINRSLANSPDFIDYKKENDLFQTKKAFDNAKENGVGFRKVREFLGQTWSESDVRGAFKILKLIDKEYFTQADVGTVASMGLLETVGALGEYIYEGKKDQDAPDYPIYWKREILNDIVDRCSPSTDGWDKITVAQIRRARTMFEKDGINPVVFLKSGNTKAVFDVIKATKALLFDADKTEDVNYAAVDALAHADGFEGYEKLAALQEAVKKSMKASFARLAKGEPVEEGEPALEAATEESLQDALDAEGAGNVIVPDLFAGEQSEKEGEVIPLPTNRIVETYCQTATHLQHGTKMLITEVDNIGENANLDASVDDLLAATIQLAAARLGRDRVVMIFKDNS